MADDLKVRMGVDIDGVLQGMKRAEKSLEDFKNQAARFKAALDKATDPASIIRLNKAIEATERRIKAITTVGTSKPFDNFTKGSNQAGQSLINLGRIAQDAPFGFIGIQNNLNPLLESFGQLKKETGSTGGALKALGSQLIGPAGLGIALSAVTAALTFAQMGTTAWTRGLTGNKGALEDLKEEAKKFKESLDDVESSALSTGIKLKRFAAIAADATLPLNQRNEALKEANKILGEHGEKLTLTTVGTQAATAAIEQFTQATINQALTTKYADRVADLYIKQRDLIKQIGDQQKIVTQRQVEFSNTVKNTFGTKTFSPEAAGFLSESKDKLKGIVDAYKFVTRELQETSLSLTETSLKATSLFGELGTKDKVKKKVQTIKDVIAELSREIDFLNAKEIAFGTNEAKSKISAIESAAEKLIKDFKVAPDDALINKLFFGGTIKNDVQGFNIPGIQGLKEKLIERLKADLKGPAIEIIVPANLQLQIENVRNSIPESIAPFLKNITNEANAIGETLAFDLASSFGDNLGKALSGQGSLENVFAGLFQSLGNSLSQLGDLFIKTAIQVKIFKDLLLTNPTLALIAGIGLKALGSLIKSTTKLPGFADGVTGFRGGLAMVGERGPELVRLPSGSDVIPNHSLGAIGGGQAIEVIVRGEISGQTILLAGSRAQKSLNRVG